MRLTLGIDIGSVVDPTAIALAEQVWKPVPPELRVGDASPAFIDHYYIRHLERLELGQDYPEIVRALVEIWKAVCARLVDLNVGSKAGKPVRPELIVYVDATGVGLPVVHMLMAAGVPIRACYFTHGDRRNELKDSKNRPYIQIGKAYLVSRMQSLLQTERIHLPKTKEARVLAKELLNYEIKVDQNANDKYGAFKVGTHDDLVTALGLTVQEIVQAVGMTASVGGYQRGYVPHWGQAPVLNRAESGGVPMLRSGTGPNSAFADGGTGLSKYGSMEELQRLIRRSGGQY